MTYCKNYCEEKDISTSELSEVQKTLYYIAENMKVDKSISEEGYEHFQQAIKSLKQELCEDCISRQAVLNEIPRVWNSNADKDYCMETLRDFVTELQPTKPKTGHWMWRIDETLSTPVSPYELNYAGWVCSCCHEFPDNICEWDDPDEPPTYKFCPNCGAKMEVE